MKKNSVFFERILQVATYKGFKSINDFSKNGLGYNASEKINRLKDASNKPSYDILMDISNKFEDININWLLTGKGEMVKAVDSSSKYTNTLSVGDNSRGIRSNQVLGGNFFGDKDTNEGESVLDELTKLKLQNALLEKEIESLNIQLGEKDKQLIEKDKQLMEKERIIQFIMEKK